MLDLELGNRRIMMRASNAGVEVARQKVTVDGDGDKLAGPIHRAAVAIGDHETLGSYRLAVRDLLMLAGLTQDEASDLTWQRITQVQWNNR